MGKRWRLWFFAVVVMCILTAYSSLLHEQLPKALRFATGLRDHRHEPKVIVGLFATTTCAAVLAVIPSGSVLVAATLVAYVYGIWGLLLAWPAVTLGLSIIFRLARLMQGFTKYSASSPPACLQGNTPQAIIKGSRRMLKERPKRTAALLTFGFHAPLSQFLLGWATDLRQLDDVPACVLDGFKVIIPILKGMALRDLVDVVVPEAEHGAFVKRPAPWSAVVVKVLVIAALISVVVCVGRSVKQELAAADTMADDDAEIIGKMVP